MFNRGERCAGMSDRWNAMRRGLVVVVALLFVTGALDEDEVLCEEAIEHLRDCCTSFIAPNVCGDSDGYCGMVTTLSRSESECIMDLDCGPRAEEVCGRIEALQEGLDNIGGGDVQRVCP